MRQESENPWLKLAIDIGPLVVFFAGFNLYGLFWATGAFMLATATALAVSWALTRRIPLTPLIAGGVIFIFGGLTLLLHDEIFIKMKPTILNTLFAIVLMGGLATGRLYLKRLLGKTIDLADEGWHGLTVRWCLFFIFMACLNEAVWRNYSTELWVNFKVFGMLPLSIAFALMQIPYMRRHELKPE